MKKTIRILANNQPGFLLQVTDLLLKHRVKIKNFISMLPKSQEGY